MHQHKNLKNSIAKSQQSRDEDAVNGIEHQNIVSLLGYCIHGEARFLVYEIMHNGSLESQLHGPSHGSTLTWHLRMKIALDVSRATLLGFLSKGLSIEEGEFLLKKSVKLAVEARDKFWDAKKRISRHSYNRALVAASIGSYGAYLADGSEYSGCYGPNVDLDKLKDFHRRRLQVLVEAGPDLLAFETIPNKLEAQAVSREIRKILTQRAASFNFALDDVSITGLPFGKDEQDKRSATIRAQGEAKSAQLIGETISKNQSFLTLRKIEVARDIAQTISKSANRLFLNSDELLLNH
ncbi:unnamed protein product [Camellia sinensis]